MDAERLIKYIRTLPDAACDVDRLKSLVSECRASSQLDATYKNTTPLDEACHIKCEPAVKLLLQAGASVNLQSIYLKRTPLHRCMQKHNRKVGSSFAIAIILLDYGADVNDRDFQDRTPLHMACEAGEQRCVDLLLRCCACQDAVDDSHETPLVRACALPSHKIVERLVAAGCDIDHNRGAALMRLLRTRKFSLKTVKLLVSNGADLAAQCYLRFAYTDNNIEAMKYLITQGADVNAAGIHAYNVVDDARTALHQVCREVPVVVGCDAVEMLLRHGADINKVDKLGMSALHYASEAINPNKVSVLLNWGADMHLVDNHKHTPLLCTFDAILKRRFSESRFSDFTKTARLLMAACAILSESELVEVRRIEVKYDCVPIPCCGSQTPKIIRFLRDIRDQCRQPRRLIDTCRIKIRSCIGGQKDIKVRQLFLPNKLKEFLLFSDVFSSEY